MELISQHNVTISISGKVISRGGASYGMEIGLVNLESGDIYFSKMLSIFKQRHSVIENIPEGKYRLFYFQGIPAFNTTDNVYQDYFGVLEFKSNNCYYIGNLIGRKDFELNSPIIYTIEDQEIPKGLTKILKRRKLLSKDEEILRTYPYKSDSLIITNKQ